MKYAATVAYLSTDCYGSYIRLKCLECAPPPKTCGYSALCACSYFQTIWSAPLVASSGVLHLFMSVVSRPTCGRNEVTNTD